MNDEPRSRIANPTIKVVAPTSLMAPLVAAFDAVHRIGRKIEMLSERISGEAGSSLFRNPGNPTSVLTCAQDLASKSELVEVWVDRLGLLIIGQEQVAYASSQAGADEELVAACQFPQTRVLASALQPGDHHQSRWGRGVRTVSEVIASDRATMVWGTDRTCETFDMGEMVTRVERMVDIPEGDLPSGGPSGRPVTAQDLKPKDQEAAAIPIHVAALNHLDGNPIRPPSPPRDPAAPSWEVHPTDGVRTVSARDLKANDRIVLDDGRAHRILAVDWIIANHRALVQIEVCGDGLPLMYRGDRETVRAILAKDAQVKAQMDEAVSL